MAWGFGLLVQLEIGGLGGRGAGALGLLALMKVAGCSQGLDLFGSWAVAFSA